MKKNITFCLLLTLTTMTTLGQTTAMDWTKDDCDGNSHNLFSELDGGNVILCEYVMNCVTCISAANYLNEIYLDYEVSDPGRVKFYAIDWKTAFDCSSFQSWASGLSCTLFLDGYDEVNYYGGFGMPTVVVLGGTDHHVYYNKLGYNNSTDNGNVRKAIDEALKTTAINETDDATSGISINPNPATASTSVNYSISGASDVSIEVLNIFGETVKTVQTGYLPSGNHTYQLNTESFVAGIYFIQIRTESGTETIKLSKVN